MILVHQNSQLHMPSAWPYWWIYSKISLDTAMGQDSPLYIWNCLWDGGAQVPLDFSPSPPAVLYLIPNQNHNPPWTIPWKTHKTRPWHLPNANQRSMSSLLTTTSMNTIVPIIKAKINIKSSAQQEPSHQWSCITPPPQFLYWRH